MSRVRAPDGVPRKRPHLSGRQVWSFSNEVCLAAREVMLRIVKLLRGEVSAVYKRSFNIIYFVFLQECIDKRGKLCYHKQCRVEYGT